MSEQPLLPVQARAEKSDAGRRLFTMVDGAVGLIVSLACCSSPARWEFMLHAPGANRRHHP